MKILSRLIIPFALSILCAACGRREASDPSDASGGGDLTAPGPAAIPADWPAPDNLPPCPGHLSLEESEGNPQSGSATLLCTQSPEALSEFYTEHLAADGWIMASSLRQGNDHHLQFRRGARFVRLQISPANPPAATRIRLAWSLPGNAILAEESQAPDYGEEQSEPVIPSMEW